MTDTLACTEYRDLIPVIVERENATLPDGFTHWGVKSVRADLRTYHDYQWPFPGAVAVADNIDSGNTGACPARPGDGLCVATSWWGMASGGIPASTLLLVAYRDDEVLGRDVAAGKLRLPRVAVVAVVDGVRLLREAGAGAYLYRADLSGADLTDANLRAANLSGADLRRAYLTGADLTDANLRAAYLYRADLSGADLRRADLSGADLRRADLSGAYLSGADLTDANLTDANLRAAYLYRADLSGAYLSGAYLTGADLTDANLYRANLYRADLSGAIGLPETSQP